MTTLLRRQTILRLNRLANISSLLAPPAVIAGLVGLMKQIPNEPKLLFMIVFSALWFGCSAAVREVVDELGIYRRERGANLRIGCYLGSKLSFLAGLSIVQSAIFISVLTIMGGQEGHFLVAWGLTAIMNFQGALIGLLISVLCSTPERALHIFPLALIPQLLLAGLFVPVRTPDLLLPVKNKDERRIEFIKAPDILISEGMSPVLRYGLSPLMVGRWGLEALADLYIHDKNESSVMILNAIAITMHPDDTAKIRAYIEAQNAKMQGNTAIVAPRVGEPATTAYLAILAGFIAVMTAIIYTSLKFRDLKEIR